MSNILYFLAGMASLVLGIFIFINEIKIFIRKKQDELGFDIGLLGGGLCAMLLGIGVVEHYLPLVLK